MKKKKAPEPIFHEREWCRGHITEARFCPDCSEKKRAAAQRRYDRKKRK